MAPTASPLPATRHPPRAMPWDLAGLIIVGAMAAWTLVASSGRDQARPVPVLLLLGSSAGLFAAGRLAALRFGDNVPKLVASGIAGAFLISFPGVLASGGPPTDYANTNATLAGLGVVAAAAAASTAEVGAKRGWLALTGVLLLTLALSESAAAAAALTVAAALAAAASARRDATVATLGGLLATWLTVGITAAVAEGEHLRGSGQGLRVVLWHRALDLLRDAPLRGHGAGSFTPPLANLDADLRWAHHEYLQQAAELGVVGLVLLLSLVAWLFVYLWWGRHRGLARTIAGASAVTLVALHAAVDHVLHTAAVPLTLSVLAGWATADPRPSPSGGTPSGRSVQRYSL